VTGGGRRPQVTLREVAARAGISLITASRALAPDKPGLPVRPETRALVLRAAGELGYRPNAQARAMRGGRHGTVGVVLVNNPARPLVNLPAFEYLLGINAGLEPHGYTATVVRLTDLDGHNPDRVRVLREHLLDGMVVLSQVPEEMVRRLESGSDRVVWLDTGRRDPLACLDRDEVAAGALAVGALAGAGRRRVVWLQRRSARVDHYSLADRSTGAHRAAHDAGLEWEEHLIDDDFTPLDPAAVRRSLTDHRAGLLLSDPALARRACAWLAHAGLVPGRDLGVACCDADDALLRQWPELTTVVIPRHPLGEQAAAMMVSWLAGRAPPSVMAPPELRAGCTA
jgi:LacI family transcriptional regulator